MMAKNTAREVNRFLRQLQDDGATVVRRHDHWRCIPRGCTKGFVTIPCSPSDWRWKLNAKADLRRVEKLNEEVR